MHDNSLLVLCGIGLIGLVCHYLGWRLRLPSIFFLVLAGVLAGPVFGLLDPDALFGDLLTPFVSIAVAIVLFEGSLTLRLREIRDHGDVVRRLVTVGILITWLISTAAAHFVMGWNLTLAALFGAIVSVSGPTVVMPLLRTVRLRGPLASILRWEGILIDALGAILAVLVFTFIAASQAASGVREVISVFATIVVAGLGLGCGFGYLLGHIIRRAWVPDYLRDYLALATVLAVFGIAETIEHESGLLAVTVMGVWLANMRGVELDDVLNFKESLTLILVAGLFIILSARLDLAQLGALSFSVLGVLLILQFIGGPLRALVCTIGASLNWQERVFLGWMFPRGIVAAAVSALFALRLEELEYPNADELVPVVFGIILGTVIIQSVTARPLARWLGVSDPEPTGILVLGGNRVALTFAKALKDSGQQVLVVDEYWANVRRARMAGLRAFYGSAVSGYAEERLDLAGIGSLLAASRRPNLNELACVRYADDFGRDQVYTLATEPEKENPKYRVAGETRGQVLLDGEQTVDSLEALILDGAEVRATEITEEFTYADYREQQPEAIVLFVTDEGERTRFPIADKQPIESLAKAGNTISALTMKRRKSDTNPQRRHGDDAGEAGNKLPG